HREGAEADAGEHAEENRDHLRSRDGVPGDAHQPHHPRSSYVTRGQRAVAGGCALGLATGWNVANTGAVAQALATVYGIGLASVGLFTTALVVTHLALQIPAGKLSDRLGPRRIGLVGLVVIAVSSSLSLADHDTALTIATRAATGVGTGLAFVAGSAYVRTQ